MRVALGSDHAALDMKNALLAHLTGKGCDTTVFAPENEADSRDYPFYAEKAAEAITGGSCDMGILLCGTGAGMCIAANKVPGIRAVNCSEAFTARLAKEHNDANVLCIGARVVAWEVAEMIVDTWLEARFQGERHARRVALIEDIEKKYRK